MGTPGGVVNGSHAANAGADGGTASAVIAGPMSTPRGTVVVALLPPLMWSMHEITVYVGSSNLCRLGFGEERALGLPVARLFILVATVIALGVIGWMFMTLRQQRIETGSLDDGLGPSSLERVGFAVYFGTIFAVISAIGVILTALPGFLTVCG